MTLLMYPCQVVVDVLVVFFINSFFQNREGKVNVEKEDRLVHKGPRYIYIQLKKLTSDSMYNYYTQRNGSKVFCGIFFKWWM